MTAPRRITAAIRPRRTRAEIEAPDPPQPERMVNLKRQVTTLAPLMQDWGVPRNPSADERLRATLAHIRRSWRQIRG